MPIGLLLGSISSVQIMKAVVRHGISTENILSETMKQLLEDGKVSIIQPWILVLATVVAFATVYLALLRPMKIASRITAIEAIRYQGEKTKKRRAGKKRSREKNERDTRNLVSASLHYPISEEIKAYCNYHYRAWYDRNFLYHCCNAFELCESQDDDGGRDTK